MSLVNWIESQLGIRPELAQLAGSTSTTLYQFEDNVGQGYVLRTYDNAEWLAIEPDLCEHEAHALQVASQADVATPELVAYETDDAVAGVQVLLMTRLNGQVWLQPDDMQDWLKQSAQALASIHRVDAPDLTWRYYRYIKDHQLTVPTWSQQTNSWQKAIELLKQPAPTSETVFIHRDYHPTNFLWQNGKLSGVVDWINACVGSIGADVGHMRVNLASLYGIEIADAFLHAYQQANPDWDYHPYWDILALADTTLYDDESPSMYRPWLDFGVTGLTDALMLERKERYIQHLIKQIS